MVTFLSSSTIIRTMDDIRKRIAALKEERNALILAHNYCLPEVQGIADHIGDSLGLSIIASETDRDVIVFCGVSFMCESAKILNPDKTVLMPEKEALCPMASMCDAEQLASFRASNPGTAIVGYVNSTASSKCEMDLCCTSSNAVKAVSSLTEENVLFVPDRNLGSYVASKVPSKNMRVWSGYCCTHHSITEESVTDLKEKYPDSVVLAHPECRPPVLAMADYIGSTENMMTFAHGSVAKEFVILTEVGMRYRLEKENPGKTFHFPDAAICTMMKMTTLRSVLRALENMETEVVLSDDIIEKASVPLRRMIGIK